MILAVDAGNSRIKWGLHDGTVWRAHGAVDNRDSARLLEIWANIHPPQRVVVSNVAGESVKTHLVAAFQRWPATPRWVTAQAAQCGVINRYDRPSTLGSDRWAALVAAWHLHRGGCLVVDAGTAMTVDTLSAQGEFLGGIIVPGPNLMRRALAEATTGVLAQQGEFKLFPTNTADAVATGVLNAAAGAVERMYTQLAAVNPAPPLCILSGGAAHLLGPCLDLPLRQVDNLVLEGLVWIAREQ